MGRTKIGLKLFFLSLLMVGCSTSGKLEYLCDSEDILSIYWNKGLLAGPSDIWLDAFRCPSTSDFRCLILEGYAISVGYDKNVKVGDEWFFNGSEFKYIMDFSGIDTCRTENSFLCYKPQLKK